MLSCFSRVWLFASLWTAALQALLSMAFSRREYWSGLPSPPPGISLIQGSNPCLHWQAGSLPLVPPGKPSLLSALSQLPRERERRSAMSDSLWPHRLYSPRDSPGQNTGVGSLSLLQGIFPTQGSNPSLLHCRRIVYQLSHQGSPTAKDLPYFFPLLSLEFFYPQTRIPS